jgi:RND superfamily putative drug exporter
VLIDATLIRGILLPAALALLGDRAWRLRPPQSGQAQPGPAQSVPAPSGQPQPGQTRADQSVARAGLPPQRA